MVNEKISSKTHAASETQEWKDDNVERQQEKTEWENNLGEQIKENKKQLETILGFDLEESLKNLSGVSQELFDKFFSEFSKLDEKTQIEISERIQNSILNEANEVKKLTGLKWILFEISRINKLKEQWRENYDNEKKLFPLNFPLILKL